MTLKEAKQELIERYKYLYENAILILAPFMYEQPQKEDKTKSKPIHQQSRLVDEPLIYLKINRLNSIIPLFEEFLLSERPLKQSKLYQMMKLRKKDVKYLIKVKHGLAIFTKQKQKELFFNIKLDMKNILDIVNTYIEEQSGDQDNKQRKILIINEYYKLYNYKNDSKTVTSEKELSRYYNNLINKRMQNRFITRDKKDTGVKNNSFIETITKALLHKENHSIFTEKEKQNVYLYYHDELPYNLEIKCSSKDDFHHPKLTHSKNTIPCGKKFIIKEEAIFISSPNQYYQLCPYCGFIVNVSDKIISDKIKVRIIKRCQKDQYLYRKMCIYSELLSLETKSDNKQKRLLH